MVDGSRIPPSEQAALEALLAAERDRVEGQIVALNRDFAVIVDSSAHVCTDDEHDPEGSTTAFERAQVAALLRQARNHLADLDDAFGRLRAGRYGLCDRCGQPIVPERLAARRVARTCLGCAAARPGRIP